ncbi:hypothetical protein [Jannaschia pohangensis]|nr:hypothetical protein [Jannaschia pohangensis]
MSNAMNLNAKNVVAALILATFALGGCSAGQVIDNTVDVTGTVVKTGAKGVVGAGRLVGRAVSGGDDAQ